jgi:short-subunit dehydrogenase
MQNKVLIFGSTGGVGCAVKKELLKEKFTVIEVNRTQIDFSKETAKSLLYDLLNLHQPDVIVNCTGIFGGNEIDFDKIFNINVKANWNILEYYKENLSEKLVKFITIGSNSYDSGRRDYILYAASKAALFNIYQGAAEYFIDKNLIIGIINPGKIRTRMIEHLLKSDSVYLTPEEVAQQTVSFLVDLKKSSYININK